MWSSTGTRVEHADLFASLVRPAGDRLAPFPRSPSADLASCSAQNLDLVSSDHVDHPLPCRACWPRQSRVPDPRRSDDAPGWSEFPESARSEFLEPARPICGGIARRVAGGTQREPHQPYLLVVRQLCDEWRQLVGGQALRHDGTPRPHAACANVFDRCASGGRVKHPSATAYGGRSGAQALSRSPSTSGELDCFRRSYLRRSQSYATRMLALTVPRACTRSFGRMDVPLAPESGTPV